MGGRGLGVFKSRTESSLYSASSSTPVTTAIFFTTQHKKPAYKEPRLREEHSPRVTEKGAEGESGTKGEK
jgi:hypothetical protein